MICMHIYFNIRKAPSLNKKNMHAHIINMHRITLNMLFEKVLFRLLPFRPKSTEL